MITIEVNNLEDLDLIEPLEERLERKEQLKEEKENILEAIEKYCSNENIGFDMIDDHRCSIEVECNGEFNLMLGNIEENICEDTYLSIEE